MVGSSWDLEQELKVNLDLHLSILSVIFKRVGRKRAGHKEGLDFENVNGVMMDHEI